MNPNETRTLWISILSALFAVFLLYSYSQEKKAEYDKRYGAFKRVVVAAADISEMETIDESKLNVIDRPVDFMEPEALSDPQDAIGEVAAAPIKKGEQILKTKLLSPGPLTGISLQVSPNKRAVTIPIDETRAVAKLIRPGDRIDLMAVLDVGKGPAQRREAKTIMQDVAVLATGLRVVNNIPRLFEVGSDQKTVNRVNLSGDTTYTTITIEANPKEAQDLIFILASAPGSLYTVLRNPNDRLIKQLPISTLESVLAKPDTLQLQSQLRAPTAVEVKPVAPPPAKTKKKGPFVEL